MRVVVVGGRGKQCVTLRRKSQQQWNRRVTPNESAQEFLALKQESRILGHSSKPVCGFSMIEQVRLCAIWPMENWLGSSLNHIKVGDHCPRILL